MPHDLPKAYDPTAIEDRWAEYWVRENLFAQPTPEPTPRRSEPRPGRRVLYHPAAAAQRHRQLHMGHMFEQAEIDILVRWRRMTGRRACGCPAPTTPASPRR
jgi:valyl-tRNA synthetase